MTPIGLHATCVLIGEGAILIRGPSGSGKSTLAFGLLAAASHEGLLARLVGDDRITLECRGERLIARGAAAIAGRMEARGIGILPVAFEPAAIVRLVVDLVEKDALRLPGVEEGTITLHGTRLPHVTSRIRSGLETLLLRRYRPGNDTLMIE